MILWYSVFLSLEGRAFEETKTGTQTYFFNESCKIKSFRFWTWHRSYAIIWCSWQWFRSLGFYPTTINACYRPNRKVYFLRIKMYPRIKVISKKIVILIRLWSLLLLFSGYFWFPWEKKKSVHFNMKHICQICVLLSLFIGGRDFEIQNCLGFSIALIWNWYFVLASVAFFAKGILNFNPFRCVKRRSYECPHQDIDFILHTP